MRGIWIWVITVESMKAAVASPAPELPPPTSSAYRGTTDRSNWKPKSAAKATKMSRTTGLVNNVSRSDVPVFCAGPFTPHNVTAGFPGAQPRRGTVLTPAPRRVDDVDDASLYLHVLGG